MMGFNIGIKDIIDIVLTAILLFSAYRLLKRSGAANVFVGVMTFIIVWFLVSQVFKMELLGGIFDGVISVGAFALIVLFQTEIKRFFQSDRFPQKLGNSKLIQTLLQQRYRQ